MRDEREMNFRYCILHLKLTIVSSVKPSSPFATGYVSSIQSHHPVMMIGTPISHPSITPSNLSGHPPPPVLWLSWSHLLFALNGTLTFSFTPELESRSLLFGSVEQPVFLSVVPVLTPFSSLGRDPSPFSDESSVLSSQVGYPLDYKKGVTSPSLFFSSSCSPSHLIIHIHYNLLPLSSSSSLQFSSSPPYSLLFLLPSPPLP